MAITDETSIKEYYQLRQQLDNHTKDMRDVIMHPNYCLQFLQPGRLIKVKYKDYDFGWGAVVEFKSRKTNKGEVVSPQESYLVEALLVVASDVTHVPSNNGDLPPGVRPPPPGDKGKMETVPIVLNCIESIGHLRVFLPQRVDSSDAKAKVRKALEEVKKRFPDGIAILDPIENMNIHDESFKRLLRVGDTPMSAWTYQLTKYRKSKFLSHVSYLILSITHPGCQTFTASIRRRSGWAIRSRLSRRKLQMRCR